MKDHLCDPQKVGLLADIAIVSSDFDAEETILEGSTISETS
jgi:hypothetical protein